MLVGQERLQGAGWGIEQINNLAIVPSIHIFYALLLYIVCITILFLSFTTSNPSDPVFFSCAAYLDEEQQT